MLLFIIGFLSGIIGGMGIGGGTILIPGLIFFAAAEQHIAQSVNLMAFLPTALVAIIIHTRNKSIHYNLALWIALAGIVGAFIGSRLAVGMSSFMLRRLFGVFLLGLGSYEFFRGEKKKNKNKE